jgi:hypothetical protein
MKKAKSSRMWGTQLLEPGLPPMSFSREKPTWATMAPSLPEAALMPCEVDR